MQRMKQPQWVKVNLKKGRQASLKSVPRQWFERWTLKKYLASAPRDNGTAGTIGTAERYLGDAQGLPTRCCYT
jgi:hypothetical protein